MEKYSTYDEDSLLSVVGLERKVGAGEEILNLPLQFVAQNSRRFKDINSSLGLNSVRIATTINELSSLGYGRRAVYKRENYAQTFNSGTQNLEFDKYDSFAIPIIQVNNGLMTEGSLVGTILRDGNSEHNIIRTSRIILDSEVGLPSDFKNLSDRGVIISSFFDISEFRKKGKIFEWSRFVSHVKNSEFNSFLEHMGALYLISKFLGANYAVFSAIPEHIKHYSKYGETKIISDIKYSKDMPIMQVLVWNLDVTSDYFKTKVLSRVKANSGF